MFPFVFFPSRISGGNLIYRAYPGDIEFAVPMPEEIELMAVPEENFVRKFLGMPIRSGFDTLFSFNSSELEKIKSKLRKVKTCVVFHLPSGKQETFDVQLPFPVFPGKRLPTDKWIDAPEDIILSKDIPLIISGRKKRDAFILRGTVAERIFPGSFLSLQVLLTADVSCSVFLTLRLYAEGNVLNATTGEVKVKGKETKAVCLCIPGVPQMADRFDADIGFVFPEPGKVKVENILCGKKEWMEVVGCFLKRFLDREMG